MQEFIWFVGAATSVQSMRGYTPGHADGRDMVATAELMSKLNYRAQVGEAIDPSEFPIEYSASLSDPNRNLVLPMWHSGLLHVRDDLVAVLRRFDLGNTVLVPIRIALADGAGVRTDFQTMSVANLKATVNPALSEPLPRGHLRRPGLRSAKPIHPGVFAWPSALAGPDIWIDPQVARTIFVTDRLAQALKAEEYAPKLGLKKVRVCAEEA